MCIAGPGRPCLHADHLPSAAPELRVQAPTASETWIRPGRCGLGQIPVLPGPDRR